MRDDHRVPLGRDLVDHGPDQGALLLLARGPDGRRLRAGRAGRRPRIGEQLHHAADARLALLRVRELVLVDAASLGGACDHLLVDVLKAEPLRDDPADGLAVGAHFPGDADDPGSYPRHFQSRISGMSSPCVAM